MTSFEKLLIAHLIGDWIVQTHWEAMNKGKDWYAAIRHGWKWTLAMLVGWAWASGWRATYIPGDMWIYLLILSMGLLHAVIDRRWPVVWLFKIKEYIPPGRPREVPDPQMWLVICIDQVLHILQVAVIAAAL